MKPPQKNLNKGTKKSSEINNILYKVFKQKLKQYPTGQQLQKYSAQHFMGIFKKIMVQEIMQTSAYMKTKLTFVYFHNTKT